MLFSAAAGSAGYRVSFVVTIAHPMSGFFQHPFWSVGFRPFFMLAALSGAILPLLWGLVFSGRLSSPAGLSAIQWHAHEMFYGFGWAVLGGFLLTATRNWVKIQGYHGPALLLLVVAWGIERMTIQFGGLLPEPVFWIGANLFLAAIVVMLLFSLLRYRHQDSFDDNYFFLIILPVFLLAKNLILLPAHFEAGVGMTLALFRVAFLVMLERTLSGFMQSAFGVAIYRDRRLDLPIKGTAVLLVAAPWMPPMIAASLSLLLAVALVFRLMLWKPLLAVTRIDIGIMYYGYLGIVLQLLAVFFAQAAGLAWVGSMTVHLFTFGVMALIIPAMMIRISKGHTGRPVVFDALDRLVLYLMMAGFALRIVVPQGLPAQYRLWIVLAALCWFAGFGLLAWRYVRFYFQPRVDGR